MSSVYFNLAHHPPYAAFQVQGMSFAAVAAMYATRSNRTELFPKKYNPGTCLSHTITQEKIPGVREFHELTNPPSRRGVGPGFEANMTSLHTYLNHLFIFRNTIILLLQSSWA